MIRRLAVLAALGSSLFADGGAILLQKKAGEYLVTVFASPAPLRAGLTDISVMLQTQKELEPVMDAALTLRVASLNVKLTHDQATNKLLYAATLPLHEGSYQLAVEIQCGQRISVTHEIQVQPAVEKSAANWPYFAIPPIGIMLFTLNRWLKRQQLARVQEKKKGNPQAPLI